MPRKILQNDQWERIEPLLPGRLSDCGVTAKDNRLFLEAVLWIQAQIDPPGVVTATYPCQSHQYG